MIPYILNKYKVIKIEKKITDKLETFPKKSLSTIEEYVATVKIYHLDEDGDQTTTRIRITFNGTANVLNYPPDKVIFQNVQIGSFNNNFYFRAQKIAFREEKGE